jgi:serine/threonine protein kinase
VAGGAHARQKRIIHRDRKPGNVLVTEVAGRPSPKVIDFGVAKATEQKLTDETIADIGVIVGTPAYMSPEQAGPSSTDMEKRPFTSGAVANHDLGLTHAGEDSHLDHRCVYESTVFAVREFEGMLLFYQAPSTKPNRFTPPFFVSLDAPALHAKDIALRSHASQRDKDFAKLLRAEGMAKSWALFLRMPTKCFEAFEINKAFWPSQPAGQNPP